MLAHRSLRYAVVVLVVTIGIGGLARGGEQKLRCQMAPVRLRIQVPARGFVWLDDELHTGSCEGMKIENWKRRPSSRFDLLVHAAGPSGSGRFWNLAIGIAKSDEIKPLRGVCFTTSTVGWRTLQFCKNLPLPWIDDVDADGDAELIIWDSFPLEEGASMAGFGLTAWVYRHATKDSLLLDWALSRRMARDLAQAYLAPLEAPNLSKYRAKAAEALKLFAEQRCTVDCGQQR